MKTKYTFTLLLSLIMLSGLAQDKSTSVWSESTFKGMKFRSIGPALMAGRIAEWSGRVETPYCARSPFLSTLRQTGRRGGCGGNRLTN